MLAVLKEAKMILSEEPWTSQHVYDPCFKMHVRCHIVLYKTCQGCTWQAGCMGDCVHAHMLCTNFRKPRELESQPLRDMNISVYLAQLHTLGALSHASLVTVQNPFDGHYCRLHVQWIIAASFFGCAQRSGGSDLHIAWLGDRKQGGLLAQLQTLDFSETKRISRWRVTQSARMKCKSFHAAAKPVWRKTGFRMSLGERQAVFLP